MTWSTIRRHLAVWLRDVRVLGAVAAAAIVIVVAVVLVATGSGSGAPTPPGGPRPFAVEPAGGTDVPRLMPIRVSFERPPTEKDGANLLQIEPATGGAYSWADDRTLVFQPDFPGLLRGKEYQLTVRAQPDAGLQEDYVATFTTEGPLTVESVVPADGDVEVPANAQLLVQFSRSVAPLTLLSTQGAAPVVEFSPPLEGNGEWLNTSLYRFTPKAFAPDTHYTAAVRAGLSSAVDGVLVEDYTWSFTTFGPAIDVVVPDDKAVFASLSQPVTVYFNQPMATSAALGVRVLDGSTPVPGTFAWNDARNAVTFTPGGALRRLAAYTVVVDAGLKSAAGGTTKAGRTTTFTTIGVPGIKSTVPAAGDTSAGRYGIGIEFTNPMNMDSLEGKVSVSGFTAEQVEQGIYSYGEQSLSLSLSLRPATAYTVSIAAGAVDRYGQALPPFSFSFTTGELPSTISFAVPGQLATYSAYAEPFLFFHSMNTTSATFSLYPLTRDEARYFQVRNYVESTQKNPFVPSQPARRTWTVTTPPTRNEVAVNSTSLTGGGPLPRGDYFVTSSNGSGWNSILVFSVVDTGVVLKQSPEELLAWVFDLQTGQPVSGASVTTDGEAVVGEKQRVADASGIVRFPLTALPDMPANRSQIDLGVTTVGGGRYGVATMAWQTGAAPYQLGLPIDYGNVPYVAHIYTERPIYRPGETVAFKGVVRRDDDASYSVPTGDVPLRYSILDSQGKTLVTNDITLNGFGTFAAEFQLPANADTGDYGLMIQWTSGDYFQQPAGTSFLVAEFRVPEFSVEVETASPSYANGDTIDAGATAAFFFGGAVAGAKVDWSVMASPFQFRAEGYERYSFGDNDYYRYDLQSRQVVRDPIRARGTATTGDDGVARFGAPAQLVGDEGAQLFTLSATITDQTGQAVAGSTTVAVHPASLYAGVRPADYVAVADEPARVDLVTVGLDGKVVPGHDVTVKVYRRTWVTTKISTPDGGRRYQSEPVDTLLQTLPAHTDGDGEASVEVTPDTAGTLRIVAEVMDERGRVARSATYLWVSSAGTASWFVSNDDILQLVADSDQYRVGDTARVLVPAPFAGATGLVTVERGKVHSAEVRDFATNSTTLEIPLTSQSVPDVFVSTVLYRPPTAEDPVPRYRVGYVQLPVSTESRVLNVAITPDRQQAKPGDVVKYAIKVTDWQGKPVRAELSVAVVDKAVLSLADERGIDGLGAFWFERGLKVQTASSLAVSINRSNDVISEVRLGGKGGGGLDDERLRQEFRNTAYWNPQVVTGDDGMATVEVTMPDNLTTWRTQVRAVSGDTLVGEATNELLSTQPLLLRPAIPRFLRVGDLVTLRVFARNATSETLNVDLGIEAAGVALDSDERKKSSIRPDESVMFEWPATVTAEGKARITFRAKSNSGLGDAVVQELPVALDVTPETVATGGVVKDAAAFEALYLPDYAITEKGSLDIRVQPSLVGLLSGELVNFDPWPDYRHLESTDQLAARIIATAAVIRAEQSAGAASGRMGDLQRDLANLVVRQNPDGGWRWCECGSISESSPWVTGWALVAIGEARAAGASYDDTQLTRATQYVFAHINRTADVLHPANPNEDAFLLYALATAGRSQILTPLVKALFEQYRAALTTHAKANLLIALASDNEGKESPVVQALLGDLASAVVPSANGSHWEDVAGSAGGAAAAKSATAPPGNSAIRATSAALQALVAVDPQHPLIEETVRWLMVARGAQSWTAGVTGARTLNALTLFAASTGELGATFDYSVHAGKDKVLSGNFRGASREPAEKTLSLRDFARGATTLVSFVRDFAKPGRMYYALTLRYLTPAKDVEALSRGISVSHEYTLLDSADTPITRARVGDVIRVKVTVMTDAERDFVEVQDFLPAGLEPIEASLKTTDPALLAKLQQDRAALNIPDDAIPYYAPWSRWYYNPFNQAMMRDDRVVLRANRLPKGVFEYVYYARATSPGDFFSAPAVAEETQFPEVFGRSDSGRFVVEP